MVLQGAVAEPAKHLMQRRIWKASTPKVYDIKKLFIPKNNTFEKVLQRPACAELSRFPAIPL
ncbi:MAG: hypothetical protein EOP02_23565 [Proteobacteria bacterium]|nr:MAG: hypothetical protein EOP02_23565 [Pseudomonadota bacterium]